MGREMGEAGSGRRGEPFVRFGLGTRTAPLRGNFGGQSYSSVCFDLLWSMRANDMVKRMLFLYINRGGSSKSADKIYAKARGTSSPSLEGGASAEHMPAGRGSVT
jgi:hypothetical protein